MLQQLVKAQREDVKAIIEEEGRQIDHLKSTLDAEVKKHRPPYPYPTPPLTPNPYPYPSPLPPSLTPPPHTAR